jgi:CheY-like chemotaxis protein
LSRYGYRVDVARNVAEGVALFEQRPAEFAAVLLDLAMPELGGEAALWTIKRIRPDVPVIASTGETEAHRRFAPGVLAGSLKRPYGTAELARKLKKALPKSLVHKQTNG